MDETLRLVLIIALFVLGTMLSMFGEWLVIKTRLRNCKTYIGEIVYFDEIPLMRGAHMISVINYQDNGKSRDAIIIKAKRDVVGAKISIVTDGNLAVRKKIAMAEKGSSGVYIAAVIVLIIGQFNLNASQMFFLDAALLITLVGLIIILLFYPFLYEITDQSMKDRLGWRSKK